MDQVARGVGGAGAPSRASASRPPRHSASMPWNAGRTGARPRPARRSRPPARGVGAACADVGRLTPRTPCGRISVGRAAATGRHPDRPCGHWSPVRRAPAARLNSRRAGGAGSGSRTAAGPSSPAAPGHRVSRTSSTTAVGSPSAAGPAASAVPDERRPAGPARRRPGGRRGSRQPARSSRADQWWARVGGRAAGRVQRRVTVAARRGCSDGLVRSQYRCALPRVAGQRRPCGPGPPWTRRQSTGSRRRRGVPSAPSAVARAGSARRSEPTTAPSRSPLGEHARRPPRQRRMRADLHEGVEAGVDQAGRRPGRRAPVRAGCAAQ